VGIAGVSMEIGNGLECIHRFFGAEAYLIMFRVYVQNDFFSSKLSSVRGCVTRYEHSELEQ